MIRKNQDRNRFKIRKNNNLRDSKEIKERSKTFYQENKKLPQISTRNRIKDYSRPHISDNEKFKTWFNLWSKRGN